MHDGLGGSGAEETCFLFMTVATSSVEQKRPRSQWRGNYIERVRTIQSQHIAVALRHPSLPSMSSDPTVVMPSDPDVAAPSGSAPREMPVLCGKLESQNSKDKPTVYIPCVTEYKVGSDSSLCHVRIRDCPSLSKTEYSHK